MNGISTEGAICPLCKIGTLKGGFDCTYNFEQDGRCMLVGHTPALQCNKCTANFVSQEINAELSAQIKPIFAKTQYSMFAYQFTDLIRPEPAGGDFEIFDRVRVKEDVDTWDLYDEDLDPGMEGTVIRKGEMPFDWVVEFRQGRDYYFQVEIDRNDLEFVSRVGVPKSKKPKKAKTAR